MVLGANIFPIKSKEFQSLIDYNNNKTGNLFFFFFKKKIIHYLKNK